MDERTTRVERLRVKQARANRACQDSLLAYCRHPDVFGGQRERLQCKAILNFNMISCHWLRPRADLPGRHTSALSPRRGGAFLFGHGEAFGTRIPNSRATRRLIISSYLESCSMRLAGLHVTGIRGAHTRGGKSGSRKSRGCPHHLAY